MASSSAGSQNSENRVAYLVMTVVTLFVTFNIAETVFWMLAMGSFSLTGMGLMTCLNASVNAVVYGVFNEKYRKLFSQMFLPCNKEKRSQKMVPGEEIPSKTVETSFTNASIWIIEKID